MSKLKKQLITVALSVLMVFALVGMAVVTMPVAKADDDKEQVIAAINTVVEAADTAEEGEEKDGKLTDEELEAILDT
ncbi:MAG: hypothetical protein IJ800_06300, partial [Clostridia bacterium]|nr:hypothetical protein [Clostridia bacterium]